MTVTQAHAVNILCRHILGRSTRADQPAPSASEVVWALQILATVAHKRIGAGFDAAAVREAWDMPHTYAPTDGVVEAYIGMDAAVDRFEELEPHYQTLIQAARRGL